MFFFYKNLYFSAQCVAFQDTICAIHCFIVNDSLYWSNDEGSQLLTCFLWVVYSNPSILNGALNMTEVMWDRSLNWITLYQCHHSSSHWIYSTLLRALQPANQWEEEKCFFFITSYMKVNLNVELKVYYFGGYMSPEIFHLRSLYVLSQTASSCSFTLLPRLLATKQTANIMKNHRLFPTTKKWCFSFWTNMKYFVKSKAIYIFLSEVQPN